MLAMFDGQVYSAVEVLLTHDGALLVSPNNIHRVSNTQQNLAFKIGRLSTQESVFAEYWTPFRAGVDPPVSTQILQDLSRITNCGLARSVVNVEAVATRTILRQSEIDGVSNPQFCPVIFLPLILCATDHDVGPKSCRIQRCWVFQSVSDVIKAFRANDEEWCKIREREDICPISFTLSHGLAVMVSGRSETCRGKAHNPGALATSGPRRRTEEESAKRNHANGNRSGGRGAQLYR